ncbi:MAG: hypothetical protein DME29_04285 [Verrucomicrobia bacterium]|nr:MAG: hypothetical protein DME29_04285 [Verrucomicrobiota bacterium]
MAQLDGLKPSSLRRHTAAARLSRKQDRYMRGCFRNSPWNYFLLAIFLNQAAFANMDPPILQEPSLFENLTA